MVDVETTFAEEVEEDRLNNVTLWLDQQSFPGFGRIDYRFTYSNGRIRAHIPAALSQAKLLDFCAIVDDRLRRIVADLRPQTAPVGSPGLGVPEAASSAASADSEDAINSTAHDEVSRSLAPGAVLRAWQVIEAWLRDNAPVSFAELTPPEDDAVARVTEYLGRPPVPELAEYLRVVPSSWNSLFGHHFPLSASRMVDESLLSVQISAEAFDEADQPAATAGTPSHAFTRSFLRITSDGGGNALFVDLRPGPQRGCVSEWDKVDGSYSPEPLEWVHVGALLDELASALGDGSTFMRYYRATTREGKLDWEPIT